MSLEGYFLIDTRLVPRSDSVTTHYIPRHIEEHVESILETWTNSD